MTIRRKLLLASAIVIAFFLLAQVMMYFYAGSQISGETEMLEEELFDRSVRRAESEIKALADSLVVFLDKEEDCLNDSMYHAAVVLQKLDMMTEVTQRDMDALLRELRVNDLYLTDIDGNFTLSTEPGAAGVFNLFDIWDGYRMIVTGEAAELPSAIKIKVETGEIFKFTAIPRYNDKGEIIGVIESALEVGIIQEDMKAMIDGYRMINSVHLFEPDGLTLLSIENPGARSSFTQGLASSDPGISSALGSSDPIIQRPGDGSIIYYCVIDRFGFPGYVMRLEMEESYFMEDESLAAAAMISQRDSALNYLLQVVGVGIIGMIIVSIAYILLISQSVIRPVHNLQKLVRRVAKGDVSPVQSSGRGDELGALESDFTDMVQSINQQARVLDTASGGDYTITIPIRSEEDVMNKAIDHLIDSSNTLINGIREAANEVATVANDLSEASNSLAQGSVEQSAAIETLSGSINAMTGKITENAEVAHRAAELAETIKTDAETGSGQMDKMILAVQEINEASVSISNVIKVIDEIAFQTNILALNAAVEAARAGQHGKGFAVVADEVRSLAAKSAEAAQDTGSLIANSMEKAELGAKITQDTVESLQRIITGINESADLVGSIAASHEAQQVEITRINVGVDELSRVVHQNSSAAQQSAAAGQEMNNHAELLRQQVKRFKLRNDFRG